MRRLLVSLGASCALCVSAPSAAQPSDSSGGAPAAAKVDPVEKRAGAFATVALGMPGVDFVNELVGARFELAYTQRFAFGLSLAYANLKGKDGRVSNVLPEASLGYHVPLTDSFGIPLRFAGGYLPKNGPTLRLTTGFDFSVSENVAFELAVFEPMVWIARDQPELSLNLGGAVRARF